MLQAAIGRVNARAGEERRIIPERDEKTLILVDGLVVELLCGLSQRVQTTEDLLQTISRADVLTLTSAEAGHNHPKLYRKPLLRGVKQSTPWRITLTQFFKKSAPAAAEDPSDQCTFLS